MAFLFSPAAVHDSKSFFFQEDGMAKSFIILLVSLITFSVFAQDQGGKEEPSTNKTIQECTESIAIKAELSADKLIPAKYLERLNEIKKILDINGLSLKLGAGLDGNSANRQVFSPEQSKQRLASSKISLNSRMAYGIYPTEAEFVTALSFEYVKDDISQSNKFQETMSSFLFNVEQYFVPRWEAYGFIERFSNSYMGVDQRWEMGCGFKWEGEIKSKKQKEQWLELQCNSDIENYLKVLLEILEGKIGNGGAPLENDFYRMAVSLRETGPSSLEKICYDLRSYKRWIELFNDEKKEKKKEIKKGNKKEIKIKKINKLKTAWGKKCARLQFDFASSFFWEITHPSLTFTVLSQSAERKWLTPIAEKKQFDPESKLRLALRVGSVWRPSKNSEVSGKCYFKFPLTNAYVRFGDENKYDFRIDAFGKVAYKIPIVPGSSKIIIGMQLEYFYDQITSFLDQKTREAIIKEKDSDESDQKLGIKHYIYNFLGPKSFFSLKATVGWEM